MKANRAIKLFMICLFNIVLSAPLLTSEQEMIDNLTYGFGGSLFNTVSRTDAQIAMEVWLNEISSITKISGKSKAVVCSDLTELSEAVIKRQVDLVGLLTIDFLRIRDAVPLEPALSYSINGHVGSQFILVVPKERVSGGLSSLRNKKILIHKSDETGIIPISWLNSLLRKQGLLTTDRFFSSVKMVDKASQAGLPVYLYQADCSVITDDGFETLRLLNPDLGEKLVVLERSSYLLVGMVAYRSDLPGNVKKEIKEIAVRLASYPKGNQILTLFKIGAFCDFQSSDLDSLLELMREDKGILSASKTKILQQSP